MHCLRVYPPNLEPSSQQTIVQVVVLECVKLLVEAAHRVERRVPEEACCRMGPVTLETVPFCLSDPRPPAYGRVGSPMYNYRIKPLPGEPNGPRNQRRIEDEVSIGPIKEFSGCAPRSNVRL